MNQAYALSQTYPSVLVVPRALDDGFVEAASQQRSRSRLPVLSWLHPRNGMPMCRSAQPLMGLSSSTSLREDETLIHSILRSSVAKNPSAVLHLIDARPRMSALANAATGKGFESIEKLNDAKWAQGAGKVQLHFLDIENIHTVRSSYQNMMSACLSCNTSSHSFDLLGKVGAAGWLQHTAGVMRGALFSAREINNGNALLVHCSDGWDRTAQISCLVQLMLDPFARTIPGFAALVEREWCSFGYQFDLRMGFGEPLSETSPVFVQFLETVWQISMQFPSAFEFSEAYLLHIADAMHSSCFANFCDDCERHRSSKQDSVDAWQYLNRAAFSDATRYLNPRYRETEVYCSNPLWPDTEISALRLWEAWFLRHTTAGWYWRRHQSNQEVSDLLHLLRLRTTGTLSAPEPLDATDRQRLAATKIKRWWFRRCHGTPACGVFVSMDFHIIILATQVTARPAAPSPQAARPERHALISSMKFWNLSWLLY